MDHPYERACLLLAARDQANGSGFFAHLLLRQRPSQDGLCFHRKPRSFVDRPAVLHQEHGHARVAHERIHGQREGLKLAIDAHSRNVLIVIAPAPRMTRTPVNVARWNVSLHAAIPRSVMSVNLQNDEVVGGGERPAAGVEFDVVFQGIESAARSHFAGSERPAPRQRDILLDKLGDRTQRIFAEDSRFAKIRDIRIHGDDHR